MPPLGRGGDRLRFCEPAAAKPANEVPTDFGAESTPEPNHASASACAPHREALEQGLSRGRNAMAIWQDLVDASGFSAGYQSVLRYISKLRPSTSRQACVVIHSFSNSLARGHMLKQDEMVLALAFSAALRSG